MSDPTLEQRVAELEREVAEFKAERANGRSAPKLHEPGTDDWKKTIGTFDGDPVMKEIIDETLRFREQERQRARAAFDAHGDGQSDSL